jgi:uncharacterized membrane protein
MKERRMKQIVGMVIAGSFLWMCGNVLAVDFTKDIAPVIENSCVKCHKAPYVDERTGRTKKPKAGLRMDSYEELMKGSEDGEVIVPGDPEKSSVYTSVMLPADHDDVMPPEDKADPLTDAQKKMLHDWIKEGAKK